MTVNTDDMQARIDAMEARPAVDIAADVAVERVARAIHAADEVGNYPVRDWDAEVEGNREDYRRLAQAALSAVPPADEALRDDLCELLNALGLGAYARPYSAHEVMQRDAIPMARSLRTAYDAEVGAVEALARVEVVVDECHAAADALDWRAGRYLKSGSQAINHYRLADRAAERREVADRLRAALAVPDTGGAQ